MVQHRAASPRRSAATLFAAVLLAACSSAPAPTGTSPASTGQVPAGSGSVGSSLTPGLVVGPGSLVASETAGGLDGLTSYQATLTKSFEGSAGGVPQSWSSTIDLQIAGGSSHLTVATQGSGALEIPGELYEVDGTLYVVHADMDCSAAAAGELGAVREMSEPANELYAVVGAEPSGDETVNGVAATRASFDERAIGLGGLATATGELWTATSGAAIVRYNLTIEGGADFFGEGATGKQSLQYELTSVNEPLAIEVPGDCPAGEVDAEQMPGATDVVDVPGLLKYSVAGSIKDAIAFYEAKAAGAGWARLQAPLINKELGVAEYTSADGKVTVLVVPAGGGLVGVYVAVDRGE